MGRYRVKVSHVYRYSDTIDVEADNEDEAYDLGHEQFCLNDADEEQLDDQNDCVVTCLEGEQAGESWYG